jgi:hypothetical protein
MLNEQRDSMFAMQRKMLDGLAKKIQALDKPTNPEPKPDAAPGPDPELLRRLDAMETDKRFDRAVSGLNLRGPKREFLRQAFENAKPEDAGEWVKGMADMWNLGESKPETPQEPSTPARAPAPQRHGVTPTRLFEWTDEDLAADFKAKAPNPSDKYSIENKPYYKDLHKRLLAEAGDISFSFLEGRK